MKPVFFGADGAPILNLSDKEFAADSEVSVKITVKGDGSESDAPILEYDFDEEYQAGTAKDGVGSNDAALSAGASYVQDEAYGQVLYLNGAKAEGGSNSYLEFPKGFFDGHDSMTISMDVKEVTRAGNYFTFAIGQDEQKYLFLKTQPTYMKLAITKSSYQKEKVAEMDQCQDGHNAGLYQFVSGRRADRGEQQYQSVNYGSGQQPEGIPGQVFLQWRQVFPGIF